MHGIKVTFPADEMHNTEYSGYNTSGSWQIKSCALALFAASSISSCVASSRPLRMFCAIVVANKTGSWLTTPICCRSHFILYFRMSIPSMRIWKHYKPKINFRIDLAYVPQQLYMNTTFGNQTGSDNKVHNSNINTATKLTTNLKLIIATIKHQCVCI